MLHKVLCKVGNAEGVSQDAPQDCKQSLYSEQVFVNMLSVQEVSMK